MTKREVWISDSSNPKYQKIKSSFLEVMNEQAKDTKINYYDFLLVAKKLSFRFEESSHLMALKNYFAKNKNAVVIKKISDLLCISQESLHAHEEKIIVKFTVPETQFAPIKQQTHEDQDPQENESEIGNDIFEKIGVNQNNEQEREVNEKMAIILSIKVDQMEKKIKALTNQKEKANMFEAFQDLKNQEFTYQQFKGVVVGLLGEVREKVKISEDDLKTIYFVLDEDKSGVITLNRIQELKNISSISTKLKQFYKSRINKDMVKNTLFKLGKVKNNAIQIYQVKNASLLEFQNIERSIVEEKEHQVRSLNRIKPAKIPHFGPLKGASKTHKQHQTIYSKFGQTGKGFESEIRFERDKIQKILKLSKEDKRKEKKGDTVASKLRSLFIHKVILPREKMLDEEKERYVRQRGTESDLFIKASK